ncbi:MAG: hypothetical protein R3B92_02020 [Patescibacteria group bacterium]
MSKKSTSPLIFVTLILAAFLVFSVSVNVYYYFFPTANSSNENTISTYEILTITDSNPTYLIYVSSTRRGSKFYNSAHLYDSSSQQWQTLEPNLQNPVIKFVNDPTYSSERSYTAKYSLAFSDDTKVDLHIPFVDMSMIVKADPNYSKYGGSFIGDDVIKINGQNYRSKNALLVGSTNYSFGPDVYLLDIKTNWALYWDKDFNLHHLDYTDVNKPHPYYRSHSFYGVIDSLNRRVTYLTNPKISTSDLNYELKTGDITHKYTLQPIDAPFKQNISGSNYLMLQDNLPNGLYIDAHD